MESQGDRRTLPYSILESKREVIFRKSRKGLSLQITKILRTMKKMNGFLVQIIKSSLVRNFNEVIRTESIF